MKKKLLSLLLAGVLAFGSVGCVSAEELEECEATISIDVIKHYLEPKASDGGNHLPLTMTVTIPEKYLSDNTLIGFYTEGQLTQLSKLETASQKFSLTLTKEDGDGLLKTPDEIKVFVWDIWELNEERKPKLIPLTKSINLLEPAETGYNAAIESANSRMVRYLLKGFVDTGDDFTTVTEFLDNNYFTDNDTVILRLLEIMENCAIEADKYKNTHLLTSEFGRRMFHAELSEVYELVQDESNKAQIDKFANVYLNLNNDGAGEYKDYIDRLFYFLRIDINEFLNGKSK